MLPVVAYGGWRLARRPVPSERNEMHQIDVAHSDDPAAAQLARLNGTLRLWGIPPDMAEAARRDLLADLRPPALVSDHKQFQKQSHRTEEEIARKKRKDEEPTAYGSPARTAYGDGEGRQARKLRERLAASMPACRWLCHEMGLRFEPDMEQEVELAGHRLVLALRLDSKGHYVAGIVSGLPWSPSQIGNAPKALSLVECYRALHCGILPARDLRAEEQIRPSMARWTSRFLFDAGLIEPPDVILRELPADAPEGVRATWNVVHGLLQAHRLDERPGEPIPLSAPWVANEWAADREDVTVARVRHAKEWLAFHQFIQHAGTAPGRLGHDTILWRVAELGVAEPFTADLAARIREKR